MGLLDEVKKARNETKAEKREQLLENTIYTIKNGTYKFFFGVNSSEEFQELKEVIAEINEELKEDKMMLRLSSEKLGEKRFPGYEIYSCGSMIGKFYYCVQVEVDAL